MKFLDKIRNLPPRTRKIILWVVMVLLALIMLNWWRGRITERLANFQFGQVIEQLDLPKITIPQIPDVLEDEIQKIKDNLNNIEINAPKKTKVQEN